MQRFTLGLHYYHVVKPLWASPQIVSPPIVGRGLDELEILLPPFGTYDAKLFVRYTGFVVRVEDESGFAVAAKVSLHRYVMVRRVPILDEGSQ